MSADQHPPKSSPRPRRLRGIAWLREPVDIVYKAALALVAISTPFVVNSFERHMAGTTLLSQREQAESQLRAAMFGDLIGPIVGPRATGDIPLDRERLLIELLALNFHEHFEFKPLFQHVDERLRSELGQEVAGKEARESLRSIARRVKDRQIASLFAEGHAAKRPAQVWTLFVSKNQADSVDMAGQRTYGSFGSLLPDIISPDRSHTVLLLADNPDWQEDTLRVKIRVLENGKKLEATAEFTLTAFDFPLTDNTRLDDGDRFSVVVANTSTDVREGRFKLKVIWFPKDYVPPHERPLNFRDLQTLVGRN